MDIYEDVCPICGSLNKRTVYYEDYRTVEEHYFCKYCSFDEEMAYSPTYWTIQWRRVPLRYLINAFRFYLRNKKFYIPPRHFG